MPMHDKKKTKMARGGAMMSHMDKTPTAMARGGKVKKQGYAKGGMVNCGASMPAARGK